MAHNGNLLALICTGITEHIADGIEAYGIFQIVFRNEFSAQRIARHQNGFCDIAFIGGIMGCTHDIKTSSV